METMTDSSVSTTAPTSEAPSSAGSTAPESVPSVEGQVAVGESSEPGSTPAWKPTYKYKVYDKEKEIPEHFRGFITDADKEKAFRELFEKADGLDHQKPIHQQVVKERNQLVQQYQQAQQQHTQAVEGIKKIHHLSQTDLDTFFDVYKLPKEKVFQWVSQKLRMDELRETNPELAQQIEQGERNRREGYAYQDRLKSLETQNRNLQLTQHNIAMSQTLSHPEVQSFGQLFDSRFGQGSFQKQVNDFGDLHFRRTNGQYMPPWQAAQAVIAQYRNGLQPTQPQAATPPPAQPAQGATAEGGAAPATIPNMGSGRSVSPTKPRFKSLDQLRKYAADMQEG